MWMYTLSLSFILSSPMLVSSSPNYITETEDYTLIKLWPAIKRPFIELKVQSPTDIDTSNARRNFYMAPVTLHRTAHLTDECVIIENTGYYLEILLDKNVTTKPYITGGPLQGELFENNYIFEQMHFHWGNDDHCGSEHHVDGKCYSTEVHMVFYREEYGSFNSAKNHTDGVAVISFFGELSDTDNPDFTDLMNKLAEVKAPHSETTGSFKNEFAFVNILFEQEEYYAFPGSLTTPDYQECVTWIMYTNPFPISHNQLDAFRQLTREDGQGMIRENDRPLQPFGNRPIIYPVFNKEFEVESDESDSDSKSI